MLSLLQTVYDAFFISTYNLFYTSMPVLALGVFDQDVSDHNSISHPKLYAPGMCSLLFNRRVFVGSLLHGAFTSLVIFLVPQGEWCCLPGCTAPWPSLSRWTASSRHRVDLEPGTSRLPRHTRFDVFGTWTWSLAGASRHAALGVVCAGVPWCASHFPQDCCADNWEQLLPTAVLSLCRGVQQ